MVLWLSYIGEMVLDGIVIGSNVSAVRSLPPLDAARHAVDC